MQIADRALSMETSATFAMAAKARELKAQGIDIISLSLGEPDFSTPRHICEAAAKAAMTDKYHHYPPVDGLPEFKDAIINKFSRDNDLQYVPDEILISAGAKHSLFNGMQAVVNPGDEFIILAPFWVSYTEMVKLTGGVPVIINTTLENNFKVSPAQLKAAITDKTRMILLNSPSNPTGSAYTKAELKALGEVLLAHPNITILTDDIYEHVYWADEPFSNIIMACPELKSRTLMVNSVSKAYAMTGWRIGYMAGPKDVIAAAKKIQSQCTAGVCAVSQAAATAALSGDQGCVEEMVKTFKQRHDYMVKALNEFHGVKCRPAEGTFYCFIDVRELIADRGMKDDNVLCDFFMKEAHVGTVAGSAFGGPGHLRLSYATSMENLEKSIERMHKALRK